MFRGWHSSSLSLQPSSQLAKMHICICIYMYTNTHEHLCIATRSLTSTGQLFLTTSQSLLLFTVYLRPGTQASSPLKSLLEVKNGYVRLQSESRIGDMVVLGIYTLPSFAPLGFRSCGLLWLSPKAIAKIYMFHKIVPPSISFPGSK